MNDISFSASNRLSDPALVFLRQPRRIRIGAAWLDAASGRTLDVVDPATEEVVARVPAGGAEDVDRAVKAARAALENPTWARLRPAQRERLLLKLADLVEANARELAELEALDNGKPAMYAQVVDVACAVDFLRYMAGWATKLEGSTIEISPPYLPPEAAFHAFTRREPVGVVGAIIPWNFPFLMAVWKTAPVLATGCTMVLKPAEETPLTALRLAELVRDAGYPDGVFNVVTGIGQEAGVALARHPGIDKIAFTGSTEVGKLVGKAALDNVTRLSLELGGKSPVIVLDDADPDAAVAGAANAIFFNTGQVCTAGSRLFVQKKLFDRVVGGVAQVAAQMKVGPGLDAETQLGPVVSQKQLTRICGYIDLGTREGARIRAGGARLQRPGYFVQPTVLENVDDKMRITREEIFGPVVVAMPFEDLDEVAARANDTPYGLAASIWSNNLSKVHRLVPRIKAGTIWVNCHGVTDSNAPFGGYKQSGFGRELGRSMLDLYTETKSVVMAI